MTASRTILITGANSGIGLDAARQLALRTGWSKIVLGVRSKAKGEAAREELVAATKRPATDFGLAVMDLTLPDTIAAAVKALADSGTRLDAVVLNGGGMGMPADDGTLAKTADGLSQVFAMNVGGHALLVQALLDHDLLTEGATVIFTGSESSRGIPAMRAAAPVLPTGFGDLDATLQAVARGAHAKPGFDPMGEYALVKLIGTVWMRQLTQAHGTRLRALSVSPGMTSGTNALADMPTWQQIPMKYLMMPMMSLFGMAHTVENGAGRYVKALEDSNLAAGRFYASPGTGLTGALSLQSSAHQPLLEDDAFTEGIGRLVADLNARLRPQPLAEAV